MAMMEIRNVHKTFRTYAKVGLRPGAHKVVSELPVLQGVDLTVEKGDVVAILGPSGSGKTTLLRCLNFLETAAAGQLVLDAYFKTKSGLLLRAVGDNATLVTTLARDRGNMKILGLMLSNALVALGGCIVCRETRSYSATMGTGQLVYGLAAVIIGVSAFRWYENSGAARHLRDVKGLRFFATPRGTTAVIVGSILFKLCIQLAMLLVPSSMMKFITAALFLLVLVASGRKGEEIIHA